MTSICAAAPQQSARLEWWYFSSLKFENIVWTSMIHIILKPKAPGKLALHVEGRDLFSCLCKLQSSPSLCHIPLELERDASTVAENYKRIAGIERLKAHLVGISANALGKAIVQHIGTLNSLWDVHFLGKAVSAAFARIHVICCQSCVGQSSPSKGPC